MGGHAHPPEQVSAIVYHNFGRQAACGIILAPVLFSLPPDKIDMLPDLQLNAHVRLRKPHPCGSYEWTVVRLGADIGLECKGCGRRVMLTRRELARRIKAILPEEPHGGSSN
jgi:hypothetical protein